MIKLDDDCDKLNLDDGCDKFNCDILIKLDHHSDKFNITIKLDHHRDKIIITHSHNQGGRIKAVAASTPSPTSPYSNPANVFLKKKQQNKINIQRGNFFEKMPHTPLLT